MHGTMSPNEYRNRNYNSYQHSTESESETFIPKSDGFSAADSPDGSGCLGDTAIALANTETGIEHHHQQPFNQDKLIDGNGGDLVPVQKFIRNVHVRWLIFIGLAVAMVLCIERNSYRRHHEVANSKSAGMMPDLIWSDEFDGDSINLTKWTFVNGNGCDAGLCGWGNNELEWYTPSNTHIENGKLVMEARQFITNDYHPASYTSSKIISRGKADFGIERISDANANLTIDGSNPNNLQKSQRFEARIRIPWGRGIWPAFWMLPTYDTYGGWPKSGEIDILENIGKEGPNTVHGTVHYGLDGARHQYSESGITIQSTPHLESSLPTPSGALNETFHTYAVERFPGELRWFIDDIQYSSVTKEEMKPYLWPFDEDFYFILNLAVGGNWPGYPVEEGYDYNEGGKDKEMDSDGHDGEVTVFPQRLEVDYVRVYEGVFPQLRGKSIVECSDTNVEYWVVNVGTHVWDEDRGHLKKIYFEWTVPRGATITEGQGTSRILVDFSSSMDGKVINDREFVHVRADHIDPNHAAASAGLTKLNQNGIGLRVKIVDFEGKCSATAHSIQNSTIDSKQNYSKIYDFDCGRPSTCTQYVLHRTTDEYTCGERIQWLMEGMGMSEIDACREVGYVQFHGHCGSCNPL